MKAVIGVLVFLALVGLFVVIRFGSKASLSKIKLFSGDKAKSALSPKVYAIFVFLLPFVYLGVLSFWLKVGVGGDKAPAIVVAYIILAIIVLVASKSPIKAGLVIVGSLCALIFLLSIFSWHRRMPDQYKPKLANLENQLEEFRVYNKPTRLVELREEAQENLRKARKKKDQNLLLQVQQDLTELKRLKALEREKVVFEEISSRSTVKVLANRKQWIKIADVETGQILRVLAKVNPEDPPRISYLGAPLLQKIPDVFGYSDQQLRGWPSIICDQFTGFDVNRPRFGELVFLVLDDKTEKHLPASYIRDNPRDDWWYNQSKGEFFFEGVAGRSVWAIIADRNPYDPTFAKSYDNNKGVILVGWQTVLSSQ